MHAFKAAILATATILGVGLSAVSAQAAEKLEVSDNCTREQERANKNAVINSFGSTLNNFLAGIAPDYDQHSPEFRRFGELNGVQGAAVFPAMRESFKLAGQGGVPPRPAGAPEMIKNYLVVAQCDIVTVMNQDFEPDPQNPGKYYPIYRFDVFRVRDGKLAAHWDGGRIPNPVPPYLSKSLKELRAEAAAKAPAEAK